MTKFTIAEEARNLQGTFRLSAGDIVLALSVTSLLLIFTTVLLTGILDDRTAQDVLAATL